MRANRICLHVPFQVHRATLHSGEAVVVKVQRPGLSRLFDIDLAILEGLASQLDAQVWICARANCLFLCGLFMNSQV